MYKVNAIFGKKLQVLNIGLTQFADVMHELGVDCVHLDWRPPGQGDQEAAELLKLLLG